MGMNASQVNGVFLMVDFWDGFWYGCFWLYWLNIIDEKTK